MFKNKYPIIVGAFTSLGLIILIAVVFTLGGQHSTFVKKFEVKAVFDDIGGLKVGDNVWLSGIKIGVIKSIDFTDNTAVLVNMNIQRKVDNLSHRDSKVKISSDGLMGNRIIIIYGGTVAAPMITENDRLYTEKSIDTKDMLSTLDESNKNLLAITNNLKEISTKILSGKGAISVLLNDSTLPKNIKHTVVDLRSAIAHLKTTSALSENAIHSFNDFSSKLNKEGTLVNDLVTDTIVFNDLRGSVSQLKSTMDNITRFSENIKDVSKSLNQQSNTAGAILHDEQMAAHLKDMIRNLDSASHKLDQDLQAVQHNFLLRGYFRKKAKSQ